MYINFWYPIAKSEDISGDRPSAVQIFGLPFATFRDNGGRAHVLSNTCVHRGGNLSVGSIENGRTVCPYHGWQYAGDGKVKRIPSLGDDPPPARAKVDSYPTQESYGIVFAFLGELPENERPPIIDIEQYGAEGWKSELYVFDVNCYFERVVENGLDSIHNEFVHPLQGSPVVSAENQRIRTPVTEIPWGTKFIMPFGGKKSDNTALKAYRSGEPDSAASSWHKGPNQLGGWIRFTRGHTGATATFCNYSFLLPIDENRTRVFLLNLRNWLLEDDKDELVKELNLKIIQEDINVLEKLDPVRTPQSNNKELLLPSDHAVLRYRDCLKQWERCGWRINIKALRDQQGDAALAVPSPARREEGNWVHDPVPLIPATQDQQTLAE